ncbi:MAG: DMT family transporter, partial [Myxococcota bacterium]
MRPSSLPTGGLLALLLPLFGFAMAGIWVRWLGPLDPLAITAGRVAVALLVLVPATLLTPGERRGALGYLRQPRVHGVAARMIGFFGFAVAGFQLAPVALVVLMIGAAPAWVLVFERVSGSAIEPRRAAGVGLTLVGSAVALLPSVLGALGGQEGAGSVALGGLLGLTASFFNAAFVFGRSRLAAQGVRPGAFLLAAMTCLWGLLLYPLAAVTQLGALVPSTGFQGLALAGLGVLSTAAPLWGLSVASRLLPPLVVALVGPLLPFMAALAAWLLLGEAPPLAFALGAPIVVGGIG